MNNTVDKKTYTLSFICTLILPVFGGIDYVFIEYITKYIDAISLASIRTFISVITFLIIHRILEGKLQIDRRDWPRFLLAGGLGVGGYYALESFGISLTSASLSSLLLSLVPMFTVIADRIFLGTKINGIKIICVILSLVGVGLVIAGSMDSEISGTILGIVMLIFAAIFWTIYIVVSKPLSEKYSPVTTMTGYGIAGTIVLLPVFFLYRPEAVLSLTPLQIFLVILFAVVTIALPDMLYLYGIANLPLIIPSITINLLPFITIIASWFVFHETLTPIQFMGGALIITSVILPVIDETRRGEAE